MRVRLAAATAVVAALTMVLASCDGSGSGRRSGGSSGGSSSSGQGDHDDDDDVDLDDVDASAAGGGGGGADEPGTGDSLPANATTAAAILPDEAAMRGTEYLRPSDEDINGFCGQYEDQCVNVLALDEVAHFNEDQDEMVLFQVVAHGNTTDATATLANIESTLEEDVKPGPLTPGGDGGTSYEVEEPDSKATYVTVFRQGPYVGLVTQSGPESVLQDTELSNALHTMLAERMSQAGSGRQPTATVREH